MRHVQLAAFTVALFTFSGMAPAAWGGGSCGPVGPSAEVIRQFPVVAATAPQGEWQTRQAEPGCFYLYKNGQIAAGFNLNRRVCYLYDGKWSDVIPLPTGFSLENVKEPAGKVLTGVNTAKVIQESQPYRLNGHPATREQCMALIEKPELPEDSTRPFLVAVGSKEFQKQVTEDLVKAPGLANKVRFSTYGPDSFQAKKLELKDSKGFRDSGKYLCLLSPDGEALAASFDYGPGDVSKFDPDIVRKPGGGSDPLVIFKPYIDQAVAFAKREPMIVLLLVGVFYLVLTTKKKGT